MTTAQQFPIKARIIGDGIYGHVVGHNGDFVVIWNSVNKGTYEVHKCLIRKCLFTN